MQEWKTEESDDHGRNQPVIFVVDDEPNLLMFVGMVLADGPWTVKQFPAPQPAMESFLHAVPKPDLLLTDYLMPSMNGLQLAAYCKERHPALKVILISGMVGAEIAKTVPFELDGFLAKPFAPQAILDLVNSVLQMKAS